MGVQRTAVSELFAFLALVSSTEALLVNDPVICYYLDGILFLYCIFATAFFVREKLCHLPPEAPPPPGELYGDVVTATRTGHRRALQRTAGDENDAYQMIESQGRKVSRKEKKPKIYESLQAEGRSKDIYETLAQQASAHRPP